MIASSRVSKKLFPILAFILSSGVAAKTFVVLKIKTKDRMDKNNIFLIMLPPYIINLFNLYRVRIR